ncbi:MAG: inositol-3-phosphate synthase [Candidatus Kerfeldbacteria bacterium]|nr:inositol-3-phosphate synthase [Candidatus Kerfeldbacteria bacterium]
MKEKPTIAPPTGRLGVLLPGLGAVATTYIAGLLLARRQQGKLFGSVAEQAHIRLGPRAAKRNPKIRDILPLANIDDVVFGGWDIFPDNAFEAARKAGVLSAEHLKEIESELSAINPMTGAFDRDFVKKLDGPHVKAGARNQMAKALFDDIERFKAEHRCDRLVMVWCGSTEVHHQAEDVHQSLTAFEDSLDSDDRRISPSMLYAYAALKLGIPYANGAPHLNNEIPALRELADATKTPMMGKDFKTGQTLIKTILAPGLKARMLGVHGWFSTNILGNRDGEVLDDPGSFRSKEVTKSSVLDTIFQSDVYPELYGDIYHKIRINYYPPRGDEKEAWDNIDLFGWLGYPMQLKVNFLCRDSILAAPVVHDLVLFLDLAKRAGLSGVQEWLGFYFKSPLTIDQLPPEHDLFIQQLKLKNTLRELAGEVPITHLEDR